MSLPSTISQTVRKKRERERETSSPILTYRLALALTDSEFETDLLSSQPSGSRFSVSSSSLISVLVSTSSAIWVPRFPSVLLPKSHFSSVLLVLSRPCQFPFWDLDSLLWSSFTSVHHLTSRFSSVPLLRSRFLSAYYTLLRLQLPSVPLLRAFLASTSSAITFLISTSSAT